jgi:cytochrome b
MQTGSSLVRVVPGPAGGWDVPPRLLTWVVGPLFLVQGLSGVISHTAGELRSWVGLTTGLFACFSLALLIVSRRHDRQLTPASTGGEG